MAAAARAWPLMFTVQKALMIAEMSSSDGNGHLNWNRTSITQIKQEITNVALYRCLSSLSSIPFPHTALLTHRAS